MMHGIATQFAAALINASDIGFTGPKSDQGLLKNILLPVYFWGGVIAVIVIVVAGYLFVTSSGNPQQVTRARNAVIGAAVGLIIILSAFTITSIVLGGF
ncbi:MAG: hypothetical protein WAQ25_00495 [Candidatus Saccharimonas sp.]